MVQKSGRFNPLPGKLTARIYTAAVSVQSQRDQHAGSHGGLLRAALWTPVIAARPRAWRTVSNTKCAKCPGGTN